MGKPYDKSDVNNLGNDGNNAGRSAERGRSQDQSQQQDGGRITPRDGNVEDGRDIERGNGNAERGSVERGKGNSVNQADPGSRRASSAAGNGVAPRYRLHPPPAQQTSVVLRWPF